VVHCAAMLAHGSEDPKELWTSNVDGTRNLMDAMRKYGVRQHVFTSTNCLWGEAMGRPVREDDPPNPVELYGRSKLEAERIILEYPDINSISAALPHHHRLWPAGSAFDSV
jgi:UDP-glucose 4-epimerase